MDLEKDGGKGVEKWFRPGDRAIVIYDEDQNIRYLDKYFFSPFIKSWTIVIYKKPGADFYIVTIPDAKPKPAKDGDGEGSLLEIQIGVR